MHKANYIICVFVLSLLIACNTAFQPGIETNTLNTEFQIQLRHTDSIKNAQLKKVQLSVIKALTSKAKTNQVPFYADYIKLKAVYPLSDTLPVWRNVNELELARDFIMTSKYHGLNPNDYQITKIDSLIQLVKSDSVFKPNVMAQANILLTQAIYQFAQHLLHGKLNPNNYQYSWNFPARSLLNPDSVFKSLIEKCDLYEIETVFAPNNANYKALYNTLKQYYNWHNSGLVFTPLVAPNKALHQGDSNQFVKDLKMRLSQAGLFNDTLNCIFDEPLRKSVKAFQLQHGLLADGIPGKLTYQFLNWSMQRYIDALKVNLERLRWLSNPQSKTHIEVNIPAYRLWYYSNDDLAFNTKVIVGKFKNMTPVFQSAINYLVFNPCWTVPNSIASEKMLTKLQNNPDYLANNNMFICLNGIEQNPDSIDFYKYTQYNFPFKVFQRSSDENALGKVKFMFPNNYSIYLHDTPSQYLFNKDARAFSHGCIRIQNALPFAELLLKNDNHNKLPSYYLQKGYPVKAYLKQDIPLQIIYQTCQLNPKTKQVQFFDDIYAFDYKILVDLEK